MAFVTRKRYVEAFAESGMMEGVGLMIDRMLWPQRILSEPDRGHCPGASRGGQHLFCK